MDTPIVILNYKTYLESSGLKALELAHDLESAASDRRTHRFQPNQYID